MKYTQKIDEKENNNNISDPAISHKMLIREKTHTEHG